MLVACEYSQVIAIDFSNNNSRVVNDITFHMLIVMVFCFECYAGIVDVKMPSCILTLRKKFIWNVLKVHFA